jgi:hypothetical protein
MTGNGALQCLFRFRVNCCWPSPRQSFLVVGPAGPIAIFLSHDPPNACQPTGLNLCQYGDFCQNFLIVKQMGGRMCL